MKYKGEEIVIVSNEEVFKERQHQHLRRSKLRTLVRLLTLNQSAMRWRKESKY